MLLLRMKWYRSSLFLLLLFAFSITFFTLSFLVEQSQRVQAAGVIHYVAPGGVCGVSPCYSSIQDAVDAATDGDEIRIAAGTYQGVQTIPVLSTPYLTATQLVALTKSLFIQGGYLASDWSMADPAANPTVLDAGGQGRVFFITGSLTSTIEGLRLINGNAANLGGRYQWWNNSTGDVGGGLLVLTATVTISNSAIMSNTAPASPVYGVANLAGGTYVDSESFSMVDTLVAHNQGDCTAGVYLHGVSAGSVKQNQFIDNSASGGNCYTGGGLYVFGSNVLVEDNTFRQNSGYGGGGLSVNGEITVRGNDIYDNWAIYGGGLFVEGGMPLIIGNKIRDNRASQAGSGAAFWSSQPKFVNNVFAHNRDTSTSSWGGGIFAAGGTAEIIHNTLVDNDGSGILIRSWSSSDTTVTLTNNIVIDHQVGVTVTAGDMATLTTTLWGSGSTANDQDWGGAGTIVDSMNIWGDPALAADGYHLTYGSAAVDAGVSSSVSQDIDGESRALAGLPDLGADELVSSLTINYATGAPGSYFTLTGTGFPPHETAALTVNGTVLGSTPTDLYGGFSLILSTANADEGAYFVTASVNPVATVSFMINAADPVRSQEGTASIFAVPAGIAFDQFIYLPMIVK